LSKAPIPEVLQIRDDKEKGDNVLKMLKAQEKNGMVVILGFGEGELASRILDELGRGYALVIYEFNHEQFNGALVKDDFTKLWKDDRVILILEEDEGYGYLEHLRRYVFGGRLWLLIHPESDGRKAQYEDICSTIAKAKALLEVNMSTQVGMGKHFMNGLFDNIPEIIKKHGVKELRDIYKNKPCVVVSPGPSLKKDIDKLKAYRDKAVYIAVDCVVPFLMEHDFIPDFICGIDPLSDNVRLYTDPRLKDIPLICIMQYTPEVVKTYPGTVYMASQYGNQIFMWLGKYLDDRGAIECCGGSVSHFGIGIAEHLGCNPIGIIGQDLSFRDSYYCSNLGEILDEPGKPLDRTENKIPIKNMHGEDVFTTPIFIAFKMWFENKFKQMEKTNRVFNLSDGGLTIEHTKEMKFENYIKEYGWQKETVPVKPSPLSADTGKIIQEIEAAIVELSDVVNACYLIIEKLHRIRRLLPEFLTDTGKKDKKNKINNLIMEIGELKKITDQPFVQLIVAYHFKIDIYLNRFDIREIEYIENKYDRLFAQTDKGLNIYGEMIEASDLFIEQCRKVLKSFGDNAEHKGALCQNQK
jgi:hypothetical protein